MGESQHRAYFERPFTLETGQGISNELRVAKALEYIAANMGFINEKLDKLIEQGAHKSE